MPTRPPTSLSTSLSTIFGRLWRSRLFTGATAIVLLLFSALLASILAPSFGAWNDTTTQTQTLEGGVVSLNALSGETSTLTANIENVAAGDRYTRYVTVENNGNQEIGDLQISVKVDVGEDSLPPAATAADWADGVVIYGETCASPQWTPISPGTCPQGQWETGWTVGAGVFNVGAATDGDTYTVPLALPVGTTMGLRITYYVCAKDADTPGTRPDAVAATCNDEAVPNSVMGSTATYTFTFNGGQRAPNLPDP